MKTYQYFRAIIDIKVFISYCLVTIKHNIFFIGLVEFYFTGFLVSSKFTAFSFLYWILYMISWKCSTFSRRLWYINNWCITVKLFSACSFRCSSSSLLFNKTKIYFFNRYCFESNNYLFWGGIVSRSWQTTSIYSTIDLIKEVVTE